MVSKNTYSCSNCGYESAKWLGQCPSCGEWNTFVENVNVSTSMSDSKNIKPLDINTIKEVNKVYYQRISSGFAEFDRVLGSSNDENNSGIVQGSVVLLSGDPGIGKSTILLQVCANISSKDYSAIYVSAEESVEQIALRAKRLGGNSKLFDNLSIIYSYNVDEIITTLEKYKPNFVVIDSIQTIESNLIRGFAGGISQVRNSANKLVNFAKKNNITLFIIGHINKEGNIAGPKILEHLVDAVIQIEGDKQTGLRVVRAHKNRFGATNEVGILKMEETGLTDVENPSEYFLTKDNLPGICRCPILEGNRIIIIEVQTLISPTIYSLPKRVSDGISISRLQLICAIIQKYLRINLADKDVYLNISGGLKIKDRAVDFAIAMSILSSVKVAPLGANTVALGEISLSGGISTVLLQNKRIEESIRLGYKNVLSSEKYKYISEVTGLIK